MTKSGPSRGFSLLELVVVMALFALVALIGVQVVAQVIRTDEKLSAVSRDASDLAYGLALLRADLQSATPMAFHPPGGLPLPALDAPARAPHFSLSIGGQATLDGSGPGRARVTWRLDPASGTVTRVFWPSLIPGDRRLASPEVTVFRDVDDLTLEIFDPEQGWGPGFPRPDVPGTGLPDALRVTIAHRRFETLQTTVTIR